MATKKKTAEAPAAKNLSETEMHKISVNTSKEIAEQKMYSVILPETASGDRSLHFCINDVHYAIPRGVQVEVPETIYKIIENMRTQERMKKAVEKKLKKMSGRSI